MAIVSRMTLLTILTRVPSMRLDRPASIGMTRRIHRVLLLLGMGVRISLRVSSSMLLLVRVLAAISGGVLLLLLMRVLTVPVCGMGVSRSVLLRVTILSVVLRVVPGRTSSLLLSRRVWVMRIGRVVSTRVIWNEDVEQSYRRPRNKVTHRYPPLAFGYPHGAVDEGG